MGLNLGKIDGILTKRKNILPRRIEKEIFVHSVNPGPNDFAGSAWPVTILTAADDCFFIFKLPKDFSGLRELAIVILPDATETIRWDIDFAAANAGELEDVSTTGDLNVEQDVIIDTITELDLLRPTAGQVEGLFASGLKAKDYVGIWFASDTDNIQVFGLRIKYV